jgi:hypothetical protein
MMDQLIELNWAENAESKWNSYLQGETDHPTAESKPGLNEVQRDWRR